jgi:hypothetical protein
MARTRAVANIAVLALLVCVAGASSAPWPHVKILFPRNTPVPLSVQAFAWQVIETRCNYLGYEREQRSFWAYETRATTVRAETVYWIRILSELPWKKTEPPATIDMAVALEDGQARLAGLHSTFVVCQ